jgi:sugar phosphate isomerase/epimerase
METDYHPHAAKGAAVTVQHAFSTLGVPGLPLDAVLALATDHGYDGIELRCAEGEPVHPDLDPRAWRSVRRRPRSGARSSGR